jgi:ADP-ribose pyrophosphatase YjhB (NUDIX family)
MATADGLTPAQRIALWADKLRDISALGLRFAQNVYDRENYRQLQDLAVEMLALATGEPLARVEPLRATLFARPTPLATGDAAVIDAAGRILLIRRADNGKWAMPGGALEVGETPAEGAAREAGEETGVRCAPVALVGVHDSRRRGTVAAHHLYQFTFLCRPLDAGRAREVASHAQEVLDTGWFAEGALPDDLDPGHGRPIREAFRVWRGDARADFD